MLDGGVGATLRRGRVRVAPSPDPGALVPGLWVWYTIANVVFASPDILRLYGLDPARGALSFQSFLARVDPDDHEHVLAVLGRALAAGDRFSLVHRLAGGRGRRLHLRGEAMLDEANRDVRVVGTVDELGPVSPRREGARG